MTCDGGAQVPKDIILAFGKGAPGETTNLPPLANQPAESCGQPVAGVTSRGCIWP